MQHLQCYPKLQALQSSPNERGKCRRRREKSARVAGNFVEKRAACLTVGVCMHNAASQMRCVIMLHFSGAFASAPPHSSASQGRVNCPELRCCHLKGAQMFAAPTCIGRTCFYSCDNLAAQYFHSLVRQFTLAIDPRKFCADISERLLKQHNPRFMVDNLALEFCTSARTVHLKRHK